MHLPERGLLHFYTFFLQTFQKRPEALLEDTLSASAALLTDKVYKCFYLSGRFLSAFEMKQSTAGLHANG